MLPLGAVTGAAAGAVTAEAPADAVRAALAERDPLELAQALGCSRAAVRAWRDGRRCPALQREREAAAVSEARRLGRIEARQQLAPPPPVPVIEGVIINAAELSAGLSVGADDLADKSTAAGVRREAAPAELSADLSGASDWTPPALTRAPGCSERTLHGWRSGETRRPDWLPLALAALEREPRPTDRPPPLDVDAPELDGLIAARTLQTPEP